MDPIKPVYASKKIKGKVKDKVEEVECSRNRSDSNPTKSKKRKTSI